MTELTVRIDSLAYGPYGIGRDHERVILVPLTAPGDNVEVRIVEEKRNYALAEVSRLVRPAPVRQSPPCPYFGECGGCPWQHVDYRAQLAAKEKCVLDALGRIGRLEKFQLFPILPSPKEYHYRHRIRLQSDGHKRLGFYRAFSRELIGIGSCLIADPELNESLPLAEQWISELKTQIQQVEIVAGDEKGRVVLIGSARGRLHPDDEARCADFLAKRGAISGLIVSGSGWRRCWGKEKLLIRSYGGLMMEVAGDVFTQVNRGGNERLIDETLCWGEFHPQDRVLELYCGAGNLTLPVAQRSGQIMAVEVSPQSVSDGRKNARLNGLDNIRWVCSEVRRAAQTLARRGERFSKVILNPPRWGAKGLDRDLASLRAEKILYVSCDPPTLARDLSALSRNGYRLIRVRPFDLFPHTYHVETLAELVPTS